MIPVIRNDDTSTTGSWAWTIWDAAGTLATILPSPEYWVEGNDDKPSDKARRLEFIGRLGLKEPVARWPVRKTWAPPATMKRRMGYPHKNLNTMEIYNG